jgi:hypothetical protein
VLASTGPVRVTVPTVPPDGPPTTVACSTPTLCIVGGNIVKVWVTEELPRVAVTMTEVNAVTGAVVIENGVETLLPAANVTEAGDGAEPEDTDSPAEVPATGAGPFNDTVPVTVVPPVTEVADSAMLSNPRTVTWQVTEFLTSVAVIVSVVGEAPEIAGSETVNVTDFEP